jgi:hypothetical protein
VQEFVWKQLLRQVLGEHHSLGLVLVQLSVRVREGVAVIPPEYSPKLESPISFLSQVTNMSERL